MVSSNRSQSPGRTPPFILVGLLVLVCFLAYNYWSLSSQNSDLVVELTSMQNRARDVSDENTQVKSSLDAIRQELSIAKKNLESVKAEVTEKTIQLDNEKQECANKQSELVNCQESLATCAQSLKVEQDEKVKIQGEKDAMQLALDAAKNAPKVCDMASCEGPVKEVVVVAAKLTGSQMIGDALAQAGLDAAKLLEGVIIPPPVPVKAEQPAQSVQNAPAPAPVENGPAVQVKSADNVTQQTTGAQNVTNGTSDLVFAPGTERKDAVEEEEGNEEELNEEEADVEKAEIESNGEEEKGEESNDNLKDSEVTF